MELLKSLIILSEKAANIARVIRKNEHLFELLVQRKKSSESNPRFVEDFKTLADVLIQEMVKHDLQKQFPELINNINGEENNVFKNSLGEEIAVEVKSSEVETSILLEKVLNGDQVAAKILAAEVHKTVDIGNIKTRIPEKKFKVNLEELGIWIDPIDCTAEYINGGIGEVDHNISLNGLSCVTILLGAFDRNNGVPVIGVINRPFIEDIDLQINYQCLWGVSLDDYHENCVGVQTQANGIICLSSTESSEVKEKLKEHNYYLVEASGAGYKLITVITGLSDAYILTKGTTFKWDTCSPHAILKSLGGNVLDLQKALALGTEQKALEYFTNISSCNANGLIAYRSPTILQEVVHILREIL